MTQPLDQREREELCDLFLELGPDAPTLCEGWDALDLAAHLVIREREPASAIGILVPRFAGFTQSRQERRAAQGFYSLVHRLRTPPLVPWRVPKLRSLINLGEYAVHHEDLRRANGRTRRIDRPDLEEVIWRSLQRSARLLTRKLDVGLDLALPDGRRFTAHAGDPVATLTGHPLELQLYLFGRGQHAEVELTGAAEATTAGRVHVLRLVMDELPEDFDRALCIVAHPDDMEYGAASVVARWTAQGKAVAYVMVSSGEAGIDGMAPDECGPLREEEQRRSATVVGVHDVRFLGHPDGLIEYGIPLRRDIAGTIRWWRPDVVVTLRHELLGWGSVNHSDHRAVGLAVLDACRDAANRWLFPESGEPWSGVRAAYVASGDDPDHYVEVSDTLARGIASLREHRAYIDGLGTGFDPAAFLRGAAEEGGGAAGVGLAVLFRRFEV